MSTPETRAPERRRVLLVEDEAMSRTLLSDLVRSAGFDVEACSSAAEAMKAFKKFDPDAVISDIDLGFGPSGLDLVVALSKRAPYLAFVILSNYAITPDYRHEALGRAAYLRKQELDDASVLIDALEAALTDQSQRGRVAEAGGRLSVLTAQQVQVLRMIAEGLSNEEIGKRRDTSVKSVEHMTSRIFTALGIESNPGVNVRVAAARIYIEEAGLPARTD